jgi:hypothetical protein
LFPIETFASPTYVGAGGNRVQLALEALYGISAGVGRKANSCVLCHTSEAGGPGQINVGFGDDFQQAASRAINMTGGNNLPANGPLSLETIFSDLTLRGLDSDGDGLSNEDEFISNTDPADDMGAPTIANDGGGGCGTLRSVDGPSGPKAPLVILLMALPALLLLGMRRLNP